MVMGPKTATRSTDETSTQPISPAGTEPCIRPRTTVARWVIGLTSMTACNHPGIVFGSTKMLLTNVSGNITIMLTPATEFSVRRIRLSIVHSHGADRCLELAARALGDHLPVVDHRYPVGQLVGLVEVLRGQQHGGALGDHAPDDLPDLVPAARVEPGRGLVEEDQFGGDDQARRDVDAPAHPAGVLLHLPVGRFGKTERVEQVGRPLPASAA